jgi:hypothetical protein
VFERQPFAVRRALSSDGMREPVVLRLRSGREIINKG